jgi:hypothetical protein
VLPPALDRYARLGDRVKDLAIQKLVAQFSVRVLRVPALLSNARLSGERLHPDGSAPIPLRGRGAFARFPLRTRSFRSSGPPGYVRTRQRKLSIRRAVVQAPAYEPVVVSEPEAYMRRRGKHAGKLVTEGLVNEFAGVEEEHSRCGRRVIAKKPVAFLGQPAAPDEVAVPPPPRGIPQCASIQPYPRNPRPRGAQIETAWMGIDQAVGRHNVQAPQRQLESTVLTFSSISPLKTKGSEGRRGGPVQDIGNFRRLPRS